MGLGAADSSNGKSLNTDLGITWGTRHPDRNWNYYGTLRGGAAKGYAGNAIFGSSNDDDPEVAPADAFFGMLSLGAQVQANPRERFVFESGIGFVDVHQDSSGLLFYLSAGLLLNLPDSR